ncbi:MAG: ABC transporter permease, partial [Armatimonadota bacterium]
MNLTAASRSLAEHWQRAVLSGLGVMVAAVAITLLVSIGKGVQKDLTAQIKQFGAGLIVLPGHVAVGGGINSMAGKSFLDEESVRLVQQVHGVMKVAELSFAGGSVKVGSEEAYPMILSTTADWFAINKSVFKEGRPFGPQDETTPVCVLGSIAAKVVFPTGSAIGKEVTINDHTYKVIGVIEDKQSEDSLFSMQSLANVTYIPIRYVKSVEDDVPINRLFVQTDPTVEPKNLVSSVEAALGSHLDKSHYSVLTQEDLLGLMYQVLGILTTLVTGLTSIALFVGGVGILSVMLMSVNERSKEIGVRMAMGAKRSDIFKQFLAEALIISLGGVLLGLAISGVA